MRRLRRWIPAASCLEQVRETGGNSCDNIAVIADALAGRQMLLRRTRAIAHWSNAEGRRLQPAQGKFKVRRNGRIRYVSSEWFGMHSTALGSDGQGPQGFSFIFLDFFDLFADLARACLGSSFLERLSRSCEVVRVRMDRTIAH